MRRVLDQGGVAMPLLDHFHPPLSVVRHWESLHARWASSIADALNRDLLPPDYYAEEQVHIGSRVEIDVATFEGESLGPALRMPAIFPDSLEVLVFSSEAGPTLVAAVELISPGNKDRADYRRAFAAKCASYLQQGVGLIIVDIVTNRQANLHNELVQLLTAGADFQLPAESLYAVAYRPVRRSDSGHLEVWPATLAVGQALPVLPLALDKGVCVPLDLETTYAEACQRRRLA
jgi:hypothetical protein